MKKLSGLDAAFLYLETETSPMQIGGVSILESHTPDGPLTLEGLKDLLRSRIHMSRTFTERLEEVPLGLSRPYWIEDPDFDLDRHVERTQLPEPGGFRELSALVTWEMSRLLPRDRPLWHLLLVEGLGEIEHIKPGSVALISRIHHAAIDGMSGTEIMRALYDPTPRPAPAAEKPRPRAAATAPSKLALLTGRGAAKDEEESGAGLGNLVRGALGG
ncbi:MAG: wax ester/triacylglycerol synthase domain-containing protein, partial [Acidobacteriota bacterium]